MPSDSRTTIADDLQRTRRPSRWHSTERCAAQTSEPERPGAPWKLPTLWTSATDRSPTASWKTLRVSHSSHRAHHQGQFTQQHQPEPATPQRQPFVV
jgi:hypothetical protein